MLPFRSRVQEDVAPGRVSDEDSLLEKISSTDNQAWSEFPASSSPRWPPKVRSCRSKVGSWRRAPEEEEEEGGPGWVELGWPDVPAWRTRAVQVFGLARVLGPP